MERNGRLALARLLWMTRVPGPCRTKGRRGPHLIRIDQILEPKLVYLRRGERRVQGELA